MALLAVLVSGAALVSAGKPIALPAESKRDLQVQLGSALELAAMHLGWVLGLQPGAVSSRKFPELFQRHELLLSEKGASWGEGCEHNVAETQDSVEFCAIRKLQALGVLCTQGWSALRPGLRAALSALEDQQENIRGLDIRRDPLPQRVDAEAFVYENERVGSGQKVLSPALHATAVSTMMRCSSALGKKLKPSTQMQWVVAAEQAVMQVAPGFVKLSHHMLGVVWEALADIVLLLPATQAAAISKMEKILAIVEKAMRKQFSKGASKGTWSYSGAAAIALYANHTGLSAAERERLKSLGAEHWERFRESLLPSMNTTQLCTCGPVSGLAQLATMLQDSRLAMLVLQLVSKDVELFQVPPGADSAPGAERGFLARVADSAHFEGAFLRSPEQLKMEGRPNSVRIDDTGTCLIAVAAALRMVEAMPGVEEAEIKQAALLAEAEAERKASEGGKPASTSEKGRLGDEL